MMAEPCAPAHGEATQTGYTRMSMFDNLENEALSLAKEHKDVVDEVAGQAAKQLGDDVNSATGEKFSSQIDAAEGQAPDELNNLLGN